MVWVKICGITNLEDARLAPQLKADALGFIFSTDSPRRIGLSEAKKINDGLRDEENRVSKVGVFVNERVELILEYCEKLELNFIQLSGDEDIDFLRTLRKEAKGLKIIKALRIRNKNKTSGSDGQDGLKIAGVPGEIKKYADFILLDSYKENVYGGTGQTFNWEIVKYFSGILPVILSGGLEPENVGKAVSIAKPFGVDASSLLEVYPGKKDADKVRRFVNIVKKVQ
jgi:phosphoribosylanthranilate isomerase